MTSAEAIGSAQDMKARAVEMLETPHGGAYEDGRGDERSGAGEEGAPD